jgi:hypothetical protein
MENIVSRRIQSLINYSNFVQKTGGKPCEPFTRAWYKRFCAWLLPLIRPSDGSELLM